MRTLSDKLLWGATYCNPLWNNTASYHSHPNLFGSDDGVASEVLNKSHFSTHHFMKWVRHINFSPRPRLLLWLELWLIRNELFPAGMVSFNLLIRSTRCTLGRASGDSIWAWSPLESIHFSGLGIGTCLGWTFKLSSTRVCSKYWETACELSFTVMWI